MGPYYKIIVNIKTTTGIVETGSFLLGNDEESAWVTFNSLKEDVRVDAPVVIRLDLTKEEDGKLPVTDPNS